MDSVQADAEAEAVTIDVPAICVLLQVLDVCGGVMLAWEMNGQELLPDHGYPVSILLRSILHTKLILASISRHCFQINQAMCRLIHRVQAVHTFGSENDVVKTPCVLIV